MREAARHLRSAALSGEGRSARTCTSAITVLPRPPSASSSRIGAAGGVGGVALDTRVRGGRTTGFAEPVHSAALLPAKAAPG